ncbi:T9SS type A sorting domain-containing protein [Thermophagus sp. OGC60D27]|uniref:T9SS type A sorting domain-containing protein n=1 Tax=Thermophagus sp. OGC60D27 TaxID=3458415 RepID=UPI0040382921
MKHFYLVYLLLVLGWSAQAQQTWYAINSGEWNNPENWTLDPAAAVYVTEDEGYPLDGDNVVIKSGKTITMPTEDAPFSANCKVLTVEGRLDLKNTSGHLFSEIRGSGRIIMEGDNFPAGDASHFTNEGKGTVVYKGSDYNLSSHTFYNVEIDLTNSSSTVSLAGELTVNGNFSVLKGAFRFGNNTTSRTLNVLGDITINAGASITVNTANAAHNLLAWGDIINNGTIRLTNLANPDYNSTPSNGYVILTAKGESHNVLQANNTTFLQRLIIDKGNDPTWRFTVNPSQRQYFRLFGQNNNYRTEKALYIKNGTLELTGATYIHSLTEGGDDFYVPSTGGLWLNGSAVEVNTTANNANADGLFTADGVTTAASGKQSFSVLGKFRITSGTLNTRTHGFVAWDSGNALVLIEGGTIYTPGFRSAGGNTGKWTYNQSGGAVYMYGDLGSDLSGSGAATFSIKGNNNVFIMTGGLMEIQDAATSSQLAINIESGEGKYSVTGGTIRIKRSGSASGNFHISSSAPFYNFEISGQSNTATAFLSSELTILNDLTIGTNGTLDVSDDNYPMNIGGDLTLQNSTSNVELRNNTTSFIGDKSSVLTNNAGADLEFYNLTISKESESNNLFLGNGSCRILNNLSVERGDLNLNNKAVSLGGDLYLGKGNIVTDDVTLGKIVLNGSGNQTLDSYSTAYTMGSVELDNNNGASLTSDVRFSYFTLTNGIMYIDKYLMRVDTNRIAGSNFSASKMIKTRGNAADKGLQYNFSLSQTGNVVYPVGVDVDGGDEYVPVTLIVNNAIGESGAFAVIPVPEEHPATNPSFEYDVLPFYWKTNMDGFSSLESEDLSIRFDYFETTNFDDNCKSYLNYDGVWYWFEDDLGRRFDHITYQNIGYLAEGDFTAAEYNWFWGDLAFLNYDTYYSRNGGGNWNERDTWSFDGHNGGRVGRWDYPPGPEDIVIIGDNDSVYITNNGAEAAQIIIEDGSVLDIASTVNHNFSEVNGAGKFRISSGNVPDANFGEFVTNDTAIFEYYGDDNYTLTNQLDQYPNLVISGSGNKTVANVNFKAKSLFVDDALLLMSTNQYGDMEVEDDVVINTGRIQFRNSGYERFVTIKGSLIFSGNGRMIVQNAGTASLEHNLEINGDIHQGDGVLNLYKTNGDNVNMVTVSFTGDGSSLFTKSGSGNSRFGYVMVNKAETDSVLFMGDFTLNAPNDEVRKPLTISSGIVSLDHPNINLELSAGGGLFKIPSTAELIVNQGEVSLGGDDADDGGLWLDGKLTINDGGVARFDRGTNNFIEYTASGRSEIEVNGSGELYVGSQIRRSSFTEAGILTYSQNSSEAVVEVGINDWGESSRAVFEILNPGSSFTMADGATLTLHNSKASGLADFYFDPETVSLGQGSTILIADGAETGAFDLYVNQPLENLRLSGGVEARLQTVPLELNGDLTIGASSLFDAEGLDVTIRGDMNNSGTFTANENTTYFSGSAGQTIQGSTTFYNLVKNGGNGTLNMDENTEIVIQNDFTLAAGSLNTVENNVSVKGDVTVAEGTSTLSGDNSHGLVMNGSASQKLLGGGAIAKLMIDNASGVVIPTQSAATTITDVLKLNNGVLDIGRNLLVLAEQAQFAGDDTDSFSPTNMVQTNLSFTDAGIRKYLPAGAVGHITFPIGSSGKYTPVVMAVTANGRAGGSIRVKAANEPHITIPAEDLDNVLQYNWTLDAEGIQGFSATVAMHGHPDDVPGDNAEDYITARILDDLTGSWNKYSVDDFDEVNTILNYRFEGTDDAGIDGDYTAGTDAAIPDKVQVFVSKNDGYWDEPSTWSVVGGGEVPGGGPKGAIVMIKHQVQMRTNGHEAYITNLTETGTLGVGSTLNHRLGKVSGNGRMILESGSLPAGEYTEFLSKEGGTLEFSGSGNYSVLSEMPQVNHLVFSGDGERILPNIDLKVLGDLSIDGGTVVNEESRLLTLCGDVSRTGGALEMRQGDARLQGEAMQTISGDFTAASALYNLIADNNSGIVLSGPVDVTNVLTFNDGIINTADDALLTVLNAGNSAVAGASRLRYVDGPMQKRINAGTTFDFPVGDNYRYGNIGIRPDATGLWTVQYFDHAASEDGFTEAGVTFVSQSEYWRVEAPGAAQAQVMLRWDSESGINPDSPDFMVISYEPTAWEEVEYTNKSGDINGGLVTTEPLNHNTVRLFTFGLKTIDDYTWIGINGTDWFDGANWGGGLVPSVANPVLIKSAYSSNNPVIGQDRNAWCRSLSIDVGKTLTLKPGASLEITDDVDNDGTIVLESTNDNLSSLLLPESTTKSGNVNVKLNLEANGAFYLSSPIRNSQLKWFYPDGDPDNDLVFVFRDELGNDKWQWYKVDEGYLSEKPELATAEAVFAKYLNGKELFFQGEVYNEDVTLNGLTKGYYLVGNPFPTAIDWEDPAGWERENLSNTIWSWITVDGERIIQTYNNNGDDLPGVWSIIPPGYDESSVGLIAPYQAVQMKVETPNASLTIKRAARVKSDAVALKSASTTKPSDYNLIRIQTDNGVAIDGTVLYFHESFLEEQGVEDSEKRFNSSLHIPEVYTVIGGEPLSINGMPVITADTLEIPLSVRNRVEGEVTLNVDLEQFTDRYDVYLEDRDAGAMVNLREASGYVYTPVELGDDHDRFVLHFAEVEEVPTVIEHPQEEEAYQIRIVGRQNDALVKISPELLQASQATIEVADLNGRRINTIMTDNTETEVELPENSGVYLIRVTANGVVESEKVVR